MGHRRFRPGWRIFAGVCAGAALLGTAYGAGWTGGQERPWPSQGQVRGFDGRRLDAISAIGLKASFGICHVGGGRNCVVDGDTVWIEGQKVRIAGIDAPETHEPRCAAELALGNQATEKLRTLLSSGTIIMTRADRDQDRYGRLLRNLAVDGRDVGEAMISAGVARAYEGGRRSWCG